MENFRREELQRIDLLELAKSDLSVRQTLREQLNKKLVNKTITPDEYRKAISQLERLGKPDVIMTKRRDKKLTTKRRPIFQRK
jgi:hypothetical protein